MQIKALVLVGSVAMTALPVAAQAADPYPPYPPQPYGAAPTPPAYVGVLPPYEIEAIVRSMGLRPLAPPMLQHRFYVLHVLDPHGAELRVLVNARRGHVVHVAPVIADDGWDGPRYGAPPPYPRYGALGPRGRGFDVDVDIDVDADIDLDRRPIPPAGAYPQPYEPRHEAPPVHGPSGGLPQPRVAKPQSVPKSATADPNATPTPRPRPESANARAEASAPTGPIRKIEIKRPDPAPAAAKPEAKQDSKPEGKPADVPIAPLL